MMRLKLLFLLSLLLVSQISFSAFGLETIEHCNTQYVRRSELIPCYHRAAVTTAYLQQVQMRTSSRPLESPASQTCERIWTTFGEPLPANDDLKKLAELETNNCYLDIAKISGRTDFCYRIQNYRRDYTTTRIASESATQDICFDLARGTLNRIRAVQGLSTNSICSAVYLLVPLLLVGIMRVKKKPGY